MISTLLNILRLVLWYNLCYILESIPGVLEKNVYSAFVGYNVLQIYVRSSCFIVFRSSIGLSEKLCHIFATKT